MEDGFGGRRQRIGVLLLVLAAAFLGGALAGGLVSLLVDGDSAADTSGASDRASDVEGWRLAVSVEEAVAEVTTFATPSVVMIINELRPSPTLPEGGIGGGAGVIVDDRGFILTNEHLVRGAATLTVVLNSGETRPASVVSHDAPFTDLAIIQISPGGLRSLALGDSTALRQGQTLIAIGSPDFDYRNSVTVGVVTGLKRRKELDGVWFEDLIQTDAAINTGNSGGPLVNLKGEVVGLVTFRDIGTDDLLFGISFAISSRTIAPVLSSIIDAGEFPRPYFGIDHRDVDREFALANGLGVDQGALVRRIADASPAQAAGILPGDVILRIGPNEITDQLSFINALALVNIDERVPVWVWRDGVVQQVDLHVTAR